MTTPDAQARPLTVAANRIFAVIDDPDDLERAVTALAGASSTAPPKVLCCEAGLQRIDSTGDRGGPLHRAIRLGQRITLEGDHMQRYEDEIQKGHYVLEIDAPPVDERGKLVELLQSHRGHFINAYSRWTTESLAP